MENLDIKEILTDAFENVFDNVKDKAGDIIEEQIVPAIDDASKNFMADLKEETANTSSIWVKVRNTLVGLSVCVLTKAVTNALQTLADNVQNEEKENVQKNV